MQISVASEILSIFDRKTNSSASTIINQDAIIDRKFVSDLSSQQLPSESKVGRWDYDEQLLYLEFVEKNKAYLESKECRRSSKVFKVMATIVKSRGADQCRSHHQKMQKKYISVPNILINCRKGLPRLKKRKVCAIQKSSVIHSQVKNQNIQKMCEKSDRNQEILYEVDLAGQGGFRLVDDIEPPELCFNLKNQEISVFDFYEQSFQMLF